MDQLILLPPDSPVSPIQMPENRRGMQTPAQSGRKFTALFKKASPVGFCLKMCLESSIWHSIWCVLIWKARVTPGGRLLFQLAPLTRRTDEIASGFWQTPTVLNGGRSPKIGTVSPTGLTEDGKKKQIGLNYQVMVERGLWPSPTVNDSKNNGAPSQRRRRTQALNCAVTEMFPTPTNSMTMTGDLEQARFSSANRPEYAQVNSGKLNPDWVELLMGYPPGWTISASGTESGKPTRRASRRASRDVQTA